MFRWFVFFLFFFFMGPSTDMKNQLCGRLYLYTICAERATGHGAA